MQKIRPLALAIVRNEKNQFLLHQGKDSVKNETFYRPLGGGIEFGERAERALEREFQEEIQSEITIESASGTLENIFEFEGKLGHELILLFNASFADPSNIKEEYEISEPGRPKVKAVWKSLEEIKVEGSKLYPLGIEEHL